ncbi:hypothetical protein J437_LFUL014958, partial [Ladona fulva]
DAPEGNYTDVKPVFFPDPNFGGDNTTEDSETFISNNTTRKVTPEAPDRNNDKGGSMYAPDEADSGMVAGIAIAVVLCVLVIAAWIASLLYKHFLQRNNTSMNFDNPVYRKTTEDQFSLEKNQLQPQRIYPSTVGEEAREPLNTPGTNDYV